MAETRTYVEFYYPGAFFDETSTREVKTRDVKSVSVPDGAFGFRFFDVMSTEEGGVRMSSARLNVSPMYYYGGRIMTLDEVRQEMPEARILISNMEGNGYARVIKCGTSNFRPFKDDDIFIKA